MFIHSILYLYLNLIPVPAPDRPDLDPGSIKLEYASKGEDDDIVPTN